MCVSYHSDDESSACNQSLSATFASNNPPPLVFISSFYRHVLEPEVVFQSDGSFSPGPMAKFLDMPQSPLFTLNLNTPESWMVESVHTRYDLDNIYLEEVQQRVCSGSIRTSGGEIFKSVSQGFFFYSSIF